MQPSREFRPIFFDLATVEDGSHLQQLILEGPGNIENVSQWLAGHINEYTRNDSQALANIALRLAHFANRSLLILRFNPSVIWLILFLIEKFKITLINLIGWLES